MPGLLAEGLSEVRIGFILGSLKIAYAVGQLLNGQLAERLPARVLLAVGMLGSAALNVAFGLAEGLYFLIFVWACNGYYQALGWTPCVRVVANWVPPGSRGRAIGVVGVLGPTRMSYPNAIGTVSFVSGLMNELVDHLYA